MTYYNLPGPDKCDDLFSASFKRLTTEVLARNREWRNLMPCNGRSVVPETILDAPGVAGGGGERTTALYPSDDKLRILTFGNAFWSGMIIVARY